MYKKNMAASGRLCVAGNAKNQQHVGPKTEPKSKQKTGTGNRGLSGARSLCHVDNNEAACASQKLWSNLVLPARLARGLKSPWLKIV